MMGCVYVSIMLGKKQYHPFFAFASCIVLPNWEAADAMG